ncbi:MAG: ATP-sensitive inward rectifier potassium channel 10 [Candidatus Cloacimonadota bacterium]|nr:MAG: ATP-sensitive inward rectifier potassium channel 10 [Candidatus Cloacimonadota bacterium]
MKNLPDEYWTDFYHNLIKKPWVDLLIIFVILILGINIIFAFLYMIGGPCISNIKSGAFLQYFYFSIQTFTTVGFGQMAPINDYANIIASIEATMSNLIFALLTGLFFAKFSLPTSKVMFSNQILITRNNGTKTLLFRTANARANHIVDATVHVCALIHETNSEGVNMRKLHTLKLNRCFSPIFSLTWTIMHTIDSSSPLYTLKDKDYENLKIDFFATLAGTDSTLVQNIHSMKIYNSNDISFGGQFEDILTIFEDGRREIDFSKFHQIKS